MFTKTITLFVSSFVLLAAAAPGGHPATPPPTTNISQCNTGGAQCCNNVQTAQQNPLLTVLAGLLGAAIGGVNVPVGISCTPITIIGASQGANCAQQPVCCSNNNFNGVINIGCTPLSL